MSDAVLIYSFGGPEAPEEVMPFLKRVTQGRVPEARLEAVSHHYLHFGGKSPINDQNGELQKHLSQELGRRGHDWKVYFANRHSAPELDQVAAQMAADGVTRAATFITSAYGSFSGCRTYREEAVRKLADVEGCPDLVYGRKLFDHPGFIEANRDHLAQVWKRSDASAETTRVLFTAHSIPLSMAETAPYEQQLRHTCEAVANAVGASEWDLVWQSRSGPPQVPWLEPDVNDAIRDLAAQGQAHVIVHPIGFLSDHMEVMFDLDIEAVETAKEAGIRFDRVPAPGVHPSFVAAVADVMEEALGLREPGPVEGAQKTMCRPGCCEYTARRPQRPA